MIAFQPVREASLGHSKAGSEHGGCTYSDIRFDEDDELNLQMVQSGPCILRERFLEHRFCVLRAMG